MRQVWRELMFCDEDQAAKLTRDPVAPAKRSDSALKKVQTHTLEDGTPTHSFQTLMTELQGIVRNTCHTLGSAADTPTFEILTTPTFINYDLPAFAGALAVPARSTRATAQWGNRAVGNAAGVMGGAILS
jgi:hypothetical protein